MSPLTARHLRRKRIPWTAADDRLLGRMPDQAVANRTGRHLNTVQRRRAKLGIEAFTLYAREWTKAELRLLGGLSDAQVGERLGLNRHTVREKRTALNIAPSAPHKVRWKYRRNSRKGKR